MNTTCVKFLDSHCVGTWFDSVFESRPNIAPIEDALLTVLDVGDGYLESNDAHRAIAALELVAASLNKPHPDIPFTDTAGRWIRKIPASLNRELATHSTAVLARILSDNSELREYWEDTDDLDAWLEYVYDLRDRLRISPR